jgi:hypothetical protein
MQVPSNHRFIVESADTSREPLSPTGLTAWPDSPILDLMEDVGELVALYYPFSRCLQEATLKRAILLYDRLLFIDPQSEKVRAGLYAVEHHQQYLPPETAEQLASEWDEIADRYAVLRDADLISFVDPAPLLAESAVDQIVTEHLQADMATDEVAQLFASDPETYPKTWSILRSRIPKSSFPYLHHQYTWRALFPQNVDQVFERDDRGHGHALFVDGRPDQDNFMSTPPTANWGLEAEALEWKRDHRYLETEEEYACVLPYYLGSSLSVSVALAVASETQAVPLTDSGQHHKLMSLRFKRASENAEASVDQFPGLEPGRYDAALHRMRQVEMFLVDHVLHDDDLNSLTLEECLLFRTATEEKRQQFRRDVRRISDRLRNEVWSRRIEDEIRAEIEALQNELDSHVAALREDYSRLFRKAAIGVAVAGAPQLLNLVVPGIPAAFALAFGAGGGGLLVDPAKEVLEHFATRRRQPQNGLTYLLAVREASQRTG